MTQPNQEKKLLGREKWVQNKLIIPDLIVSNEQIAVIPMWYNQ